MSSRFHFILDDRERAAAPVSDLIGLRSFGDVVFRRTTLSARIAEAVSSIDGVLFIHARSDADYLAATAQAARDAYAQHYGAEPDRRERRERYVAPLYNQLIADGTFVRITELPAAAVSVLGTPEELARFRQGAAPSIAQTAAPRAAGT